MRVEDLIGSRVVASVDEPWDFASNEGHNVLFGKIVSASEPGTAVREQQVALAVMPFTAPEGSRVECLVAVARYRDETGIVEHLLAGSGIDVNLHYDEQVRGEEMPEGMSPFLIGGVYLRFHDEHYPKSRPRAFALHERGALAVDLPEHGLRAGAVGTVVHIYAGEVAYEVEFASPEAEQIRVVTVGAGNLLPAG